MTRPHPTQHPRGAPGILAGPVVAVEVWPPLLVQAAWWTDPATRRRPLAIVSPAGQVLAASRTAMTRGVVAGHTTAQARLACPDVVTRPPDHAAARELWRLVLSALNGVSPLVEDGGMDRGIAYLDARGLQRLWGDEEAIARRALVVLHAQGLRARAGAGPSRAVARALARHMSDGSPRALLGEAALAFVRGLPLTDALFGLDPRLVDELRALGLATAGALAALPRDHVALRLGPTAVAAWQIASGHPEPPLTPWSPPPCLEVEESSADGAIEDRTMVERLVVTLGTSLGGRLAQSGQAAAVLVLTLTCAPGTPHLRTLHLSPPGQTTQEVVAAGRELWRLMHPPAAVERVRLTATGLGVATPHQQGLFHQAPAGTSDARAVRLARVLETFTAHYGRDQVRTLHRDPRVPDLWVNEEWGTPGRRR